MGEIRKVEIVSTTALGTGSLPGGVDGGQLPTGPDTDRTALVGTHFLMPNTSKEVVVKALEKATPKA